MKKEVEFRWLKLSTLLFCFVLFNSSLAQAESDSPESSGSDTDLSQNKEQHYISPRLQLGLHTKASLDSPIKELISSGTAVSVIKTDKEYSQIKTAEGIEGWVKSKFITVEEPAALKVEKMQTALQKAKQTMLAQLNEKTPVENQPVENQLMSNEKIAYEETIAKLEEELNAWEQLDRQDKLALEEQAGKANRILKEKLAMIASVAIGQDVDTSHMELQTRGELPELISQSKQNFLLKIKENYILLLMVSGLSFFLGIFIVDLINRKRHGGYRI